MKTEVAPQRNIYSVSRLNREARSLLEINFPLIWVEGEISNLSRPASGHIYFSLKDPAAQLRCAMFRMRNRGLTFTPENGSQVLVRGRISLYEGRGDFQLIADHMEAAGDGALRRAYEQLKQRLADEGLFDEAEKQALPTLPRKIGVITSPSGAAIHDILTVLARRFPAIPVVVYPTSVQGQSAAAEIAAALKRANSHHECDVLIVARGGGSLEDLWAFNEEPVARAIYASTIPIISGIGHESDVTIADFVADRRAATPSAAAEIASPDSSEWLGSFQYYEERLATLAQQRVGEQQQRLEWLNQRMLQQHPTQVLNIRAQRLDELEQRLRRAQHSLFKQRHQQLEQASAHLQRVSPAQPLQQRLAQWRFLNQRLTSAMTRKLDACRQQLSALSRTLDDVSPLATLGRGYAIVRRLPNKTLVRAAKEMQIGDQIEAHLAQGRITCTVSSTNDDHDSENRTIK
ncbi:MAG: exodeoxyribonuclease VII large subunit [Gammaproteobacteria bacterium]|nr:exodeoxyribonuclease VII large subunit [Gammaproteobacteria bacterium]